MPEPKLSKRVVSQQPDAIVQQKDEPPIIVSVTVNDPQAIAYAIVYGAVGALCDRIFGGNKS